MTEGNNSDSIDVLDGLVAVRKRPEMYVGALDDPHLPSQLMREALCHALDEAVDGKCSHAAVSVRDRTATVTYDAGMPLVLDAHGHTLAWRMLAVLAACSSLKKHVAIGDAHCRAGLAVLNALSSRFHAAVVSCGQSCVFEFEQGRPSSEFKVVPCRDADSTELAFTLDSEILGSNVHFSFESVRNVFEQVARDFPQLQIDLEPW